MFTNTRGQLALVSAVAVGAVVALAGCASGDPLDEGNSGAGSETLVVGSQDYYSNEIIAEIYAQALENGGFTVDRQFRIGQREAYLPEIEASSPNTPAACCRPWRRTPQAAPPTRSTRPSRRPFPTG
jgi:osmoprotectant transport system substrate-binding protein